MSEPTVRPLVPDTVRAVVEAYGRVEAVVEVAVKKPAIAELPSTEDPSTERRAYGDVVPIPIFPAAETNNEEVAVTVVPFDA